MSLTLATTCDFCGDAGTARTLELPHGWAKMVVSYSPELTATLHACPTCQTPEQAKSLWHQVDRVMALEAGVPGTMPVPVVLVDPEDLVLNPTAPPGAL